MAFDNKDRAQTDTLRWKTKNNSIAWQRQATSCKNDSENNRESRLGCFTSPGVFTGFSSLRLSFVPADATLPRRQNFSKY